MLKKAFFLACILWAHTVSAYTFLPNLISYAKNDYPGGRQNWSIDRDSHGTLYIGNSDGLLCNIYGEWLLKQADFSGPIRAVHVYNDTIWCGGDGMGYFVRQQENDFSFTGLGDFNGGLVWEIVQLDGALYFRSENNVAVYPKHRKSLQYIPITSGIWAMANWDNALWLMRRDGSLGVLQDSVFVQKAYFEPGNNHEVRKLFVHNNNLYIILFDGQLYTFNGENFTKVNLPEQLKHRKIFTGMSYNRESYCLGTISEGFVQLETESNRLLQRVNTTHGLMDNTVLAMQADAMGGVWLGLDYGITHLELKSAITNIFNEGATYYIRNNGEGTYLGTNKGVYFASDLSDFGLVPNSAGQVWRLRALEGKLYACHNSGLLELEKGKGKFVYEGSGILDFARFGQSSSFLFSTYDGLFMVERKQGKFVFRYNLNIWGNPKLVFDPSVNGIWVYSNTSGLLLFKLDEQGELKGEGFPGIKQMFDTDYGLVFSNGQALLTYNGLAFNTLNQGIFESVSGESLQALDISANGSQLAWIEDNTVHLTVSLPDGNLYAYDKLLSPLSNNLLEENSFLDLEGHELRIATDRGVKVLDMNYKSSPSLYNKPLVTSLKVAGDEQSSLYYFPFTGGGLEFSGGKKDLEIRFGFPAHVEDVVEYRWKLAPFDREWSAWESNVKQKNYTRLVGGEYKFILQSRVNGVQLSDTELHFKIKKRWYQTWWMVIPVLFVFGGSIFVTAWVMTRRHNVKIKEEKDRYKRKVSEQSLQMKNEQLLQYVEVISHKNAFLIEIKEGLEKMRNNEAHRWANKIDEEVNHEKKEFLFHKLFSELHQDFLHRLSEKHPTLSTTELRTLSFIRINLDTREIASLMNISPSSVNANRYRLRKKLELDKDVDLNQYIRDL